MANEFKIKKGLLVSGSGGTLLDVQGSVGQVFSVTDSLTGDIFSVSDVSGIPIFNVNSDGTVTIDGPLTGTSATFTGNIHLDNDSSQLQFGDDNDMQIYHNGVDGKINNTLGNFKIDSAGDITLDADGGDIRLYDGSVLYGNLANGAGNFQIKNPTQDMDISFIGNDGGSNVTALTLDMSEGGNATFAGQITTTQNQITTNIGTTSAIRLKPTSTANTTGKSSIFLGTSPVDNYGISLRGARLGSDGTPTFELATHFNSANGTVALSIDNSQNATFTGTLNIGDNLVMTGANPTISFLDTDTSADDFYIHINSNNFYVLTNRTNSPADQVDTGWETPHPLQLEADTNVGYLFGNRIFADNYHPNADIWTNARTITLGGDLSGSVSINGSANVTLTAAVSNDSHTHDGRYFTETESNAKFLTKDGSAKEWVFEINDESNFSGNKWYKVATVNKGNGGLHIRGLFSNHVEGFAAQKVDIGMVGREGGANDTLEVTGTVDVLHRAATGSDNCGIRIVEADITSSAHYHYFDVYVKTTRYQMLRLHLTKSGATTFHTSPTAVTTEPAPVSGGTTGLEIDTSTYAEGNYLISNSAPVLTATTTGTSVVGSLTAAADVIAYSDEKLKENVKTLDGSKVLQMRGVSFDRLDNGKYSSGVIAQELEKVAPELVIDDGKYKGVAYGNITGYLIEAIKEQQKQIDELKSQMAACNKTACNCNCKN